MRILIVFKRCKSFWHADLYTQQFGFRARSFIWLITPYIVFFFVFFGSAVGMRSGATGVPTWPWSFPTSHMPLTWTHAPSRPWGTRWVNTYTVHAQSVYLQPYFSKMVKQRWCMFMISDSMFVCVWQFLKVCLMLLISVTWWLRWVLVFLPRRAPRWSLLAPTTGTHRVGVINLCSRSY